MKTIPNWWKKLGPGFVTGASDDDPSGIATYSQAGAAFGLAMLWTALLTYPLMFAIQEMCARIGIITGHGLGHVIKEHYPKPLVWIMLGTLFPAITFNIAANLAGMGAVSHMLFPFFPVWLYATLFTALLIWALIFFSYKKLALILKFLCLSLFVYLIIPFLVKQDWSSVLSATIFPQFENSRAYWALLVAVFGTTLSPYLFFWQSSMSVEEKNHNHDNASDSSQIKEMEIDVNFGMFWSNLVMFFIILTTGTVLFPAGLTQIETVQDAAIALEPLAGQFAYALFAIGVISTGLLAIPVLAGCLGYLFADIFKWEKGIDKKFHEAREFYGIMLTSILLGLLMNLFQLDPIYSLIYTAIIYGILAPFLIALILHICNQPSIMKGYTNPWWSNALGFCSLLLMSGATIFLIYFL